MTSEKGPRHIYAQEQNLYYYHNYHIGQHSENSPYFRPFCPFFFTLLFKKFIFNMKFLQYKPNEGSIRYNSEQVMITGRKTQLDIISVLTCVRERRINEITNTVYDGCFPHIHVFDEECVYVTACSFWPR